MEKVLITGNAGFIGHHLAILLSSLGYKVVGLDEINDYYDINLKNDRLVLQGIDVSNIVMLPEFRTKGLVKLQTSNPCSHEYQLNSSPLQQRLQIESGLRRFESASILG
jgi:hypothetical protein